MKEFNKPTPVEEVKRERNYLQELNVRVDDAEMIKKPFFFLPRGDGQNNMLTETIEPYTNIVKDSINSYYNFTGEKSIMEYKLYQSSMFHDYLLSNINIILENGLLNFLNPFLNVSKKDIYDIWYNNFYNQCIRLIIPDEQELIDSNKHPVADKILATVATNRVNVVEYVTKSYYEFINIIIMNGYVNVNKFGDYIKKESGIKIDISRSYTSLCIQCALEMANYDIAQIAEYTDILTFHVIGNIIDFMINKNTFKLDIIR